VEVSILSKLSDDNSAQKTRRGIRKSITFIENHYDKKIYLHQIARESNYSAFHFCRLFKNQTGVTCTKYISIRRVEKAKDLLRRTNLSVSEICFDVGFSSITHFQRVFKKLEGMSPSEYKQSC